MRRELNKLLYGDLLGEDVLFKLDNVGDLFGNDP